MKWVWISLIALCSMVTLAQEGTQSGVPASLEAANGKTVRVFLQHLKDGNITFQPFKSSNDFTVPVSKVKSLTFYPKYDEEALEQQFIAGEYSAFIATLEPIMEPFWEYMVLDNNLRNDFCMLMDAYLKTGDRAKTRKAADSLLAATDPKVVQRAQVDIALVAILENDLETAKKLRGEITSESAGLYLQACIEREEKRPEDAIKTVSGIIIDHANDVDWLAPSELLCAYLYLDIMELQGTNSVITTNSAVHTARQVKNIYSGTSVAADAEKLWVSLGGAEHEAELAEGRVERLKRKAEQKAKREAEQKAKWEAEQKAKKEAEAAALAEKAASTNGVNETVEMESE
ncbi:MAG: hypothetical protein ABFR47_04275, partial [Verrucomicrobiota bacterium]